MKAHKWTKITLSFLSQRNFSLWAFLCMNTPSRWPVSTLRISMALLPQPMIWPVPMYATDVGISPHCRTMFFDTWNQSENSTSTDSFMQSVIKYLHRITPNLSLLLQAEICPVSRVYCWCTFWYVNTPLYWASESCQGF